jgi:glutathione S-transferase
MNEIKTATQVVRLVGTYADGNAEDNFKRGERAAAMGYRAGVEEALAEAKKYLTDEPTVADTIVAAISKLMKS